MSWYCTGFWSARTVSHRGRGVAVLDRARRLLKRGLASSRNVAIVLTSAATTRPGRVDSYGLAASGSDLDRRAGLLPCRDDLCAALRRKVRRGVEVVYFSHDPTHPTFAAHVAAGGRGVYESEGLLMWADGGHEVRLAASAHLPFTLHGKARHNVGNAMAVLAALISLGIPPERVVAGLTSFTSSESQNPLRLNVYRSEGVTLLVDYAHNAAAYRAIIATARALAPKRLRGVSPCPRP